MRRVLLVLTFMSVAAWSQPAQQQAQAPIPVRIEMPPESVWMMLLKVILPTILGAGLGAGLTLYGMRQNNKHNAAENAANREHQLQVEVAKAEIAAKYRSQDRRWEFRKDVYVNLITATAAWMGAATSLASEVKFLNRLKQEHLPANDKRLSACLTRISSHVNDQSTLFDTFAKYVNLSPLAVADDVAPLAKAAMHKQRHPDLTSLDVSCLELIAADVPEQLETLGHLLRKLQAAGRRDLWEKPEQEAKAESTTKG